MTAVFYCYQNEDENLPDTTSHSGYHAGFVVVDSPQVRHGRLGMGNVPCHVVDSELDLINWMIDTVQNWDPDVLAGWELHNSSWGWLAARANESFSELAYGCTFPDQRYRLDGTAIKGPLRSCCSSKGLLFRNSFFHIQSLWTTHFKYMANLSVRDKSHSVFVREHRFPFLAPEVGCPNYVLKCLADDSRIPHYSSANLTVLWKSKAPEHTNRVLKHFFQRVVMDMEIVDAAEIITKTA